MTSQPGETLAGDYLAAAIAGADHDAASASKYYRRALAIDSSNPDLIERAFASMLAAGEVDDSFVYARKLIARDPRNTLARLALSVRAIKVGDFKQAHDLGKLGGSTSTDVTALALTAWAQAGLGQSQKAVATLARLKGSESIGAYRAYHTALIDDLAGKADDARKAYKEAQDQEPGSIRLVDSRARFEARQGDVDEAKRLYGDFERNAPRNPLIKVGLAEIAKGAATPRLIGNPQQGAAEALFGLAATSGRDGEDFAAILYLRLALYLDPANAIAAVTLGEVYERGKNYEQAIAAYRQVPTDLPLAAIDRPADRPRSRRAGEIRRGHRPSAQDRPRAIPTTSRHMRRSAMDCAPARTLPMRSGPTARRSNSRARPPRPTGSSTTIAASATSAPSNGRKAEADLKQALSLFPDQPLVLNYLGYSWVDQGINIDEAFKMLRRAVDLRPKDGYIVDSLGWAFYRMGRYDDAVRTLEKAIELKPNDSDHQQPSRAMPIGMWVASSRRPSNGRMRATCSRSPRICRHPQEDRDRHARREAAGAASDRRTREGRRGLSCAIP